MDNFKKRQGKNPRISMDGFSIDSKRHNNSARPNARRPLITGSVERHHTGSLNNFVSSDGFKPSKQPKIELTSEKPRNPNRDPKGDIDLELPPAPNRKRFTRFRKKKKNRSTKQKIIRGIITTIIIIIAIVGLLLGKGYLKINQIFKGNGIGAPSLQENVDPTKLNGEGDGRINILLLGRGGDGHQGADLTDTLLVASIDPVQKSAALLSIPRDLCIAKPCSSSASKINAVYALKKQSEISKGKNKSEAGDAGLKAIESVVSEKMGIPIHYHVIVDFSGFKQAIDAVGGIDIDVKEENTVYEILYDHDTKKKYTLNVKTGMQHFDGQRALFYSRSRHTSKRGDFDRTERQRLVMIALKEKILSLGTFSNPIKVSGLLDAFGDHVKSNMSIKEVMRVYEIGKDINSSKIASVGLADPPNNYVITDNINGVSIVRPKAGMYDFSEIQNYVRNALRDSYLNKENSTVAVYNGTATPSLASKKSAELKSFGYTIGVVANAPTVNYKYTVIVDLTKGQNKYTRNYLEKRFGVTAVSNIPDPNIPAGNADFVIILGQDAVGN